jgi:CRP/FNR family transcriptional regulator, cyclic AMP receptor protein
MIDEPRSASSATEAKGAHNKHEKIQVADIGLALPHWAERARMLLDKCVWFKALNEQERRDLAVHAQSRTFASNEPIFHVGDPESSMMGVMVGTVRISLPGCKDKHLILADLRPGEFFGEIALLDGKPRSASVTALTKCELLVLERRDFLTFLERSPTACLNLMQLLCDRIRGADERISELVFFDLSVRLARTLLRYPAQGHGPPKLCLSQQELAEMVGATRENVNRCMREWQRRGILQLKNRWTIILKPEVLHLIEEPYLSSSVPRPQREVPI